ncbi:diacylglycerol kinase family lipid kinase [Shinella sp. 838]|jgi:diacylglycerol kinase family enzyme|uniref:diacylglycerol/lipid kinase family protein n=1 Tax=unclassified Shinella TaxID=2643062 RepID=UPI0003C564FA|nr:MULTISPECIES: diacylglycerol kinase family protein [unclassified Shinella]EYR81208.1 sphingosine/diacylglycerol kinase-like enzyme [Shinella sp. DD12]MCA0338445.1 diacylglycerol kinase family lipid kinase [Pseudomonadota bacterium]MDG4671393.1 diacylglycerol kinase family lipid kinase [Shinella sp. 838]
MRVQAIFNRDGGTFRTTDMEAFARHAERVFYEAGHHLDCDIVEGADIEMALRRCSDRTDLDAMLAGGGDGTVSAAAGLAWQSRMPLGIVPAGTMNLFARSLNIPLDIWQAIDALADGDIAAADIGTADDRAFVHQFSAGLHARMVRLRNAMTYRSRMGKIAANTRAAVGVIFDPPEFEVEFNVDGVEEHRMVSAINVSNNRFGENGLLYAEDLTGGHLGFYTTKPLKPAGVAKLALDILRGKLRENADVTEMTGTAVDLHFPKVDRAINCVIDGELLPMDRDVSIRLHPGELKVMVPKIQAKAMATTEPAAA